MNALTKPTFLLLFILCTISCLSPLLAQGNFEGKILYKIAYTNIPEQMKNYESMLPKELTVFIKGNKSRIEQNQMMGKNTIVSDMDNKVGFIEMEMAGQKMRMNVSTEEFKKDIEMSPNIEYLEETKTIAGYPCKKAVMKDESGTISMTIFYTDKISNKAQKEFVGLKGFPLQYSTTQQGISMEMIAESVTKQSVPDGSFSKSDGYNDISEADLKKMMGGR